MARIIKDFRRQGGARRHLGGLIRSKFFFRVFTIGTALCTLAAGAVSQADAAVASVAGIRKTAVKATSTTHKPGVSRASHTVGASHSGAAGHTARAAHARHVVKGHEPIWLNSHKKVVRHVGLLSRITGVYSDFLQSTETQPISPDSKWLLIGTTVENVSGEKFMLRMPSTHHYGDLSFEGWGNQGTVIMGDDAYWVPKTHTVVSGCWQFAFQPGVGIVKTFPSTTISAAESSSGDWAAIVASSFRDLTSTEVQVNGQVIPQLANAQRVAWSPDGTKLAALCSAVPGGISTGVSGAGNSSAGVTSGAGQTGDLQLFVDDFSTNEVTSYGRPAQYSFPTVGQQLSWSSDSRYVSFLGFQELQIADTTTGIVASALGANNPGLVNPSLFTWTSDGELCTGIEARTGHQLNSEVGFYQIAGKAIVKQARSYLHGIVLRDEALSGDSALVQTSNQRIYLIEGAMVKPLVTEPVTVWWYDDSQHTLYYEPVSADGSVYRLPIHLTGTASSLAIGPNPAM